MEKIQVVVLLVLVINTAHVSASPTYRHAGYRKVINLLAGETAATPSAIDSAQVIKLQAKKLTTEQHPVDANRTWSPIDKLTRLRRSTAHQSRIDEMLTNVITVNINDTEKTEARPEYLFRNISGYQNNASTCPHFYQVLDLGISCYPRYLIEANCTCKCEDDSHTPEPNQTDVMIMGVNMSGPQPALIKVQINTGCYCKPPRNASG